MASYDYCMGGWNDYRDYRNSTICVLKLDKDYNVTGTFPYIEDYEYIYASDFPVDGGYVAFMYYNTDGHTYEHELPTNLDLSGTTATLEDIDTVSDEVLSVCREYAKSETGKSDYPWDLACFVKISNLAITSSFGSMNIDLFLKEVAATKTSKTLTYALEEDRNYIVAILDSPIELEVGQTLVIDIEPKTGYAFTQSPSVNIGSISKTSESGVFEFTYDEVNDGDVITFEVVVEESTPTPVSTRKKFYTVYKPTDENMQTINDAIFLSGSETVDVMHYFSSYKKFFINIEATDVKQLKAGGYDFGVTSPTVDAVTLDVDCGSIQIDETFKSVMDYAPFSRLTIFLPFIGFQELDVSMVMNNVLHVIYTVDVLSGRCLAKLFVVIGENECCIAEYGGTIASDEVFSSSGQYNGSYELMTSMQLGELQTYVLISNKEPLEGNVSEYDGYPTNEIIKVGDVTGFVAYDKIFAVGMTATETEKREIESILKSGVLVD